MNRKKGFTLAELLIVVAIIAVLVTIAIPVFSSQLEKSREAKDAAEIRNLYADVMSEAISEGGDINTDGKQTVSLSQKVDGWMEGSGMKDTLEGVFSSVEGTEPKAGGSAYVKYEGGKAVLVYSDGSSTETYTDSQEVQRAKQASQDQASKSYTELETKIQQYKKNNNGSAKKKLDTLTSGAYFTLSDGSRAWYKKSASDIETMDTEKASDNKTWINFTLDENDNIIIYNYVDPSYSYSTYDASASDPEWIGSAVMK